MPRNLYRRVGSLDPSSNYVPIRVSLFDMLFQLLGSVMLPKVLISGAATARLRGASKGSQIPVDMPLFKENLPGSAPTFYKYCGSVRADFGNM